MENNFKEASKVGLRVEIGNTAHPVDRLWGFGIDTLTEKYSEITKQIKAISGDDNDDPILAKVKRQDSKELKTLKLTKAILGEIIIDKQETIDAKKSASERKAALQSERDKLIALKEEKDIESLKAKSAEEITKRLAELEAELGNM